MNIKVVADSSADLTTVDGLYYASVPLKIITEEKEFVDDASLDVMEMATYLQNYKGKSQSSCPNATEYKEAFNEAEAVLGITITRNLSGSYNAANVALKEYLEEDKNRKGFIVDTLSAGPELSLLVEKAKEYIEEKLDFDEIVHKINEYKEKTHLIFCLESLKNLANNGRVSHAVAKLSGFLGIRIIGKASEEGTLEVVHKARGEKKAMAELVAQMVKNRYCGGKVRIHHCQNPVFAQGVADLIKSSFPKASIFIQETRGLCSFYAEKGGLLIGFEG